MTFLPRDPQLKSLFKSDIQEQGRKLMAMIATAVHGLDNLDALVPALQDMGKRHATYGVKGTDYEAVAGALLWTLERELGSAFTPDVKAAWSSCYQVLADTMLAGALPVPGLTVIVFETRVHFRHAGSPAGPAFQGEFPAAIG